MRARCLLPVLLRGLWKGQPAARSPRGDAYLLHGVLRLLTEKRVLSLTDLRLPHSWHYVNLAEAFVPFLCQEQSGHHADVVRSPAAQPVLPAALAGRVAWRPAWQGDAVPSLSARREEAGALSRGCRLPARRAGPAGPSGTEEEASRLTSLCASPVRFSDVLL